MIMKKTMIMMAMAAFSLTALAQPQHDGDRKQLSKEEMAQVRTKKMVAQYGLNKKQEAKLLELNQWFETQFPTPRPGGPMRGPKGKPAGKPEVDGQTGASPKAEADKAEKPTPPEAGQEQGHRGGPQHVRMHPKKEQAIHQQYDERLQKILTKKQYKQYTADRQQRHHQHH